MHVLCIAASFVSNKSANKKLMGNREKIVGAKGGEKRARQKNRRASAVQIQRLWKRPIVVFQRSQMLLYPAIVDA